MGENRESQQKVWPNVKKLSVGDGHARFKFQLCGLLVVYTYSTSEP